MTHFIQGVLAEANAWTDAVFSCVPGRSGMVLRAQWAKVRLKAKGRVSIESGCTFTGAGSMEFTGNASIGTGSFFSATGGHILIGADVYFNRGVHINASVGGRITIGEGCLIGPNVVMRTAGHRFDRADMPIRAQGHEIGDIAIGSDCWIGANAVILGGVVLGNGAVVAAGSVVTREVAENTVVAGAPAKAVRLRGAER